MPVKSLGGSSYYVIFIDDYSRKTWLYLLKTKDEVFNKFQEFKAEIENLTNKKIKTLRTDNGGEYTSKEFVAFCKSTGICYILQMLLKGQCTNLNLISGKSATFDSLRQRFRTTNKRQRHTPILRQQS